MNKTTNMMTSFGLAMVMVGLVGAGPAAADTTEYTIEPSVTGDSDCTFDPLVDNQSSLDDDANTIMHGSDGGDGGVSTCQGGKKCDPWYAAGWEAEVSVDGSGKVRIYVECGGEELVGCDAGGDKPITCKSDFGDPTDGVRKCLIEALEGDIDDIVYDGKCYDPVNPEDFMLPVPVLQDELNLS